MVMRIVDKKAGEFMIVTIASAVHVQLASTLEGHDQSDLVPLLCMTLAEEATESKGGHFAKLKWFSIAKITIL